MAREELLHGWLVFLKLFGFHLKTEEGVHHGTSTKTLSLITIFVTNGVDVKAHSAVPQIQV